MLLDPQKTKEIQMGKILWLLTLANIRQDRQKVIKVCQLECNSSSPSRQEELQLQ